VGLDLCRIERIRRSVDRFGKDWLDEVFNEDEQSRLGGGDRRAQLAAVGFAVKEACSKAIGTGFAVGVRRQDFVTLLDGDHCSVSLTGAARLRAARLCSAPVCPHLSVVFRSSDMWVTTVAVLATEALEADILSDHLRLPVAQRRPGPGRRPSARRGSATPRRE